MINLWINVGSIMLPERLSSTMAEDIPNIGIDVSNLSFSYGARVVLEGVQMQIPVGQIWGLIGRSGTGKTTLLNTIAGLYRPSDGRVLVSGREELQTSRIRGIVFQDESLLGWLSVRDNVLFPEHKKPRIELRSQADGLLRAVGLVGRENARPHQLSAGMRKRVEFVRALVSDSKYILMDEPFGSIDGLTRSELWTMWRDLRKREPRTGVICTHDPEEAIQMCDVVVTLSSETPSLVKSKVTIPSEVRTFESADECELFWDLRKQIMQSLEA
jgi:ABC-type nitrate/sulfonate/bicarbonate transport system ATPase subunit